MVIKVAHFVHEISIHNISISHNVLSFLKNFNNRDISTYVCTNSTDNFFKKKIKKNFLISYLNLVLSSNIPKFIHIHGIWGFYEFLIYMLFFIRNTNIIIHSHGMLNEEAMLNKGKFSYYKKILFIRLMKIFIKKNYVFITSTSQEAKRVKHFFQPIKVKITTNFLEQSKIIEVKNKKLKKNFIFLGRINKHKNIVSIMKAFIAAKLKYPWKLIIFGIPDDKNYRDKIFTFSNDHQNIQISKPIFGKKKYKVIKEAWSNILFSNSEILSYSLLESSLLQVPTILSKKIHLNGIKYPRKLISSHDIKDLKKKILYISKLKIKNRILIGKKISQLIKKQINDQETKLFFYKVYKQC